MRIFRIFFVFFFYFAIYHIAAAQSAFTDSIVVALQEELKCNFAQLKEKEIPAYYMSLRMDDKYEVTVSSNFGVGISYEDRERKITPQVRVGSPLLDNFKYQCQTFDDNDLYGSREGMKAVSVPYSGNAIMGIRQGIWNETIKRYKTSVNNYNSAMSMMKTNADNEDKSPCFSFSPVVSYYEKPLPDSDYKVERQYWEDRLDAISAVFKECKYLEEGTATLSYIVNRKYIVTSNNSIVVENSKSVRLMLSAQIRAADGMICPLHKDWFAFSLDDIPDNDQIVGAVRDMINRLEALREAPVADPYSGPAIMDGEVSGIFFHEIFGHRLESHRMKSGGQTFKKMVGKAILPSSFQVYDDPVAEYYGKQPLYGHYLYDDEAVMAERVQCVENGVLKNFLVGQVPVEGFPASNGHGRAYTGFDPVSRQSNLIIETKKPYSEDELREMLISEVKKAGKEYGYYFRSAYSGLTYTGEGGSINSFGVEPVEVYRVFVDGRPDQLVRGVTLIGTPLAMFSGIVAGGDSPSLFTGECGAESGWVPVTTVSPKIFVSKIETQRTSTGYRLPQVLNEPEHGNVVEEDSDVIFRAMSDEMARTTTELKIDGQDVPSYVDYRIRLRKYCSIVASSGGLISSSYMPKRIQGEVIVLVGDSLCTNPLRPSTRLIGNKVEYDALRRYLWLMSDNMYKNAIQEYSQKINVLQKYPKPEAEADIPERVSMPGGEHILPGISDADIDYLALEKLACELSSVFLDFPNLYNTKVSVNVEYADVYRFNSEKLKVRMPYSLSKLRTNASARNKEGAEISEYYDISFDCRQYDKESIIAQVREFADAIDKKSKAETEDDFYIGPILLLGHAVTNPFDEIVLDCAQAKNTWNFNEMLHGYGYQSGRLIGGKLLGKRFLDSNLGIHFYSDLKSYKGMPLQSCYSLDFDGVKPESDFIFVEKGILRNLISGRYPGVGSVHPTGHSMIPGPRDVENVSVSTMHVKFNGVTKESARLKSLLIAEAKKAGLDYTYMLTSITGNCYLLKRVDVKTGRETLIHADTPMFDRKDFMHIIAASKEESVYKQINGIGQVCEIVPYGLLLESVEMNLKKPSKAPEFPLQNPTFRNTQWLTRVRY